MWRDAREVDFTKFHSILSVKIYLTNSRLLIKIRAYVSNTILIWKLTIDRLQIGLRMYIGIYVLI